MRAVAFADCFHPLRVFLIGSALCVLFFFLGNRFYAAGTLPRSERSRRAFVLIVLAVIVFGMLHALLFELSCVRQDACGAAGDLNCSPENRRLFRSGIPLGWMAVAVVIGAEVFHRRRRRNMRP